MQSQVNKAIKEMFGLNSACGSKQHSLELIVTEECNQNCEYCYFVNNKSLHPKVRVSHDTILKNIPKVFAFVKANDLHFNTLEIFSGEIWHTDFGMQVLQTIYDNVNCDMFEGINIPTNASFLLYPDKTLQIEAMIEKFKEKSMSFSVSASVDGLMIEDFSRPFNDAQKTGVRDQAFYDKLFEFVIKHKCGLHPMISAYAIEKWKDNWDWWRAQFKKYPYRTGISSLMMLEVRNDDWTDDKIQAYLEFLKYEFEQLLVEYNDDKQKLFEDIKHIYSHFVVRTQHKRLSCGIQSRLHVRLGDGMIVPCHRLSYDNLNYAKINFEDNSVVDVNESLCDRIYFTNPVMGYEVCNSCEISKFCMKGCLGSQFETNSEPFFPCKSVCKLLKAKYGFLQKLYDEYDLYKYFDDKGEADEFKRMLIKE